MSKPLAGKRAFDAMGRRAAARGLATPFSQRRKWPDWARRAYECGWIDQKQAKPQ